MNVSLASPSTGSAAPAVQRLLPALLAISLAIAASTAWSRYLVRAAAFDLWTHPYLAVVAVCAALSAWMWSRSGLAPALWQAGICLGAAAWGVVAWEDQTSALGRESLTSICVGASTLWISVGVLAANWQRRTAICTWGASMAVAVLLVATLQFEGLDGQGAVMMSLQGMTSRSTQPALEASPVGQAVRLEAEQFEFPGFRFNGAGVVPGERRGAWHAPEQVWAQPVGVGWSGVVVDRRRRAYTLAEVDGQEAAYCWDLETGATLWTKTRAASFDRPLSGPGPRATPTVWEDRVATLGADGQLFCRRQQDGQLLWTRNILEDANAENTMHGVIASPVWVDGQLIVTAGGQGRAVTAYNADTGEIQWQTGDADAGYSSPMLMTLDSVRQIVVLHRTKVAGYSLQGDVLWQHDYQNYDGTNAVQPLQVGDRQVMLSSGYGREAELIEWSGEAGEMSPRVVWKSKRPQTKFSSSVLHEGHLYALDNGVMCCLELASGKTLWKSGRYGHGQLLRSGNLLLVQAESGELAFVTPSPDGWIEVGRWPALGRRTWNSPCLAGHYLILRNDEMVVCYKIGEAGN